MSFYRQPFVYLTLFLIAGIIIGDFGISTQIAIILTGIVFVSITFFYFRGSSGIFLWILFPIAFILLGVILISNNRKIGHELPQDVRVSAIVQVEEIDSEEKEWRKAIVQIHHIVDGNSFKESGAHALLFIKSPLIADGDKLLVNAELERIKNKGNPGEFDAVNFWRNKNIYRVAFVSDDDFKILDHSGPNWFRKYTDGFRNSLKAVFSSHLKDEELGIANALVLGDKELLSHETRSSFSNSGAMHVLAVSGLHVGIILYIMIFLLSKFSRFISRNRALFIALTIIWIYAAITGFSPSVLRAVVMFSIITLGQIYFGRSSALNTLFFSAFLLLIFNPLFLYDIGFQLSYLAMIGIFTIYQPVTKLLLVKNKWMRKLWEGTAVGIAAQIFTLPLTLYYFHQFPNYFAITNIGMMVFSGIVLGVGIGLLVIGKIIYLGKMVGIVLGLLLFGMLYFVQFIEQLPWSVATGFTLPFSIVILMYLFLTLHFVVKIKPLYSWSGAIVFLVLIQVFRWGNLNQNELIVLNDNRVIVLVKEKDKIYCFHDAKKDKLQKVVFAAEGYSKLYPGEIEYHELKNGKSKLKLTNLDIEFGVDDHGVTIISNKKEIRISKDRSDNLKSEKVVQLAMPYLEKSDDNYFLGDGPYNIDL